MFRSCLLDKRSFKIETGADVKDFCIIISQIFEGAQWFCGIDRGCAAWEKQDISVLVQTGRSLPAEATYRSRRGKSAPGRAHPSSLLATLDGDFVLCVNYLRQL